MVTEEMKKVDLPKTLLVVDVDNVILDFSNPFITWWNRLYYKTPDGEPIQLSSDDTANYNFDKRISADVLENAIENFMLTHPVLPLLDPEIPNHLTNIRRCGYEIHLLTTCHDKWAVDRIRNLIRINIPYDSIYFGFRDKIKAISLMAQGHTAVVVGDNPCTIYELIDEPSIHDDTLIFTPAQWDYTRYVVDCERRLRVHRYHSWKEIETFLCDKKK